MSASAPKATGSSITSARDAGLLFNGRSKAKTIAWLCRWEPLQSLAFPRPPSPSMNGASTRVSVPADMEHLA
jgi:hypothetical protein